MDLSPLRADNSQLEPQAVSELLQKIRASGQTLKSFANVKPLRGVVTGCNDAFLIDSNKRKEIIASDSRSADIIFPYIRGQDVDWWQSQWAET